MVFPVHPRTRAAKFGFEFDGIRAIEQLGFLEFLQLEARARRRRAGLLITKAVIFRCWKHYELELGKHRSNL